MLARRITMYKRRLPDGSLCRKCVDIERRMARDNVWRHITEHRYIDAGSPIAARYGVDTAPFFVVHGPVDVVYTSYLKLRQQQFRQTPSDDDALHEIAVTML
jgi:hypothetical protein